MMHSYDASKPIVPLIKLKKDGPYLSCGPYSRHLTLRERIVWVMFRRFPKLPNDPNIMNFYK